MKIYYVTGNDLKVKLAKSILEKRGVEVIQEDIDTPEIQSLDCKEVAEYSAKYAADLLNKPVMKNDSGICIDELKGFPGALTKYVEPTITAEGFIRLLEGKTNRNCHWVEVIAYCEPGGEPVVFEGITKGTIDTKKSGTYGWSWDFVFIPEGETKTLGCFPDDERWDFWSQDAYKRLAEYLETRGDDNNG